MSEGREDSLTEDNSLFLVYLQQLQEIFPDEDESIIKAAISKFQIWEDIVEALMNDNEKAQLLEEGVSSDDESEDENQQPQNYAFPTKAKNYDQPCKLYLPQSLASIDMDLNLFGSFNTDEVPPNFNDVSSQKKQDYQNRKQRSQGRSYNDMY